ncbi:MAG: cytochrome b N-terminal domain-containing protein [Deltaproteobacteria bacterium]|nr:cytochrome b N-terminal domain-containing protein [Deltaproteobacteria bacterium]
MASVQVITGILLLFVYSSTMSKAYDSILILQNDVLFGKFIRNIHHWGANFIIIVLFLHMLRVFFTGAYCDKRKVNWWIGLGLFFCVLISNFTGYLLPLDQLSYWAITICTNMFEYIPYIGIPIQKLIRGGAEIGQVTLSNFFAIHIALVPIALAILMLFHFWRVRKALTAVLVIIAGLFVFAVFFNAPLAGKANPGMSPNPTKAPWYFAGLQELLQHFHPFFAVFVIPVLLVLWLICLPFLKSGNNYGGTWFISAKGRRLGLISAGIAMIIIPVMVIFDEYFLNFATGTSEISSMIGNGLIPVAVVLGFLFGLYGWFKIKYGASKDERTQSLCIFLLVSFIILTITGILFRGPGMALCWPWNITISEIASIP